MDRRNMSLVMAAGQSRTWPTVVQGFRSRPFDRDLSEAPICGIHAIILLTGHPKVTDLHRVVLCNQTVSRCQVPFENRQHHRDKDVRERVVCRG